MRTLVGGMIAALFALGAYAQAPASPEFDAGVVAYRAADYDAALASFLAARERGYEDPRLRFNLGLTYYQLRRLAEARAEFEALRADADYAGIADFHLALVAAREGDRARAAALWRSIEHNPDAALAQRAGAALGRLESARARPAPSGYLFAAAGHDSNPALLDDSVQPADGGASRVAEVFGAFTLPLSGTARAGTLLRAGAYARAYGDDNGADQRGFFGGLSREADDGVRRRTWNLDASISELDGAPFQRIASLQLRDGPADAQPGLKLHAQFSRIGAADPYVYLEGWRVRLGAARVLRAGRGLVRLAYEFEGNDRQDLAAGAEFFSYSPLRHRFELALEPPSRNRTAVRATLRYRDSRYRDPDRFQQGAGTVEERRVEGLAQAGMQLRRSVGRSLFGLLEYQYSRNAASIEVFDYDRHLLLAGLEWLPRAE